VARIAATTTPTVDSFTPPAVEPEAPPAPGSTQNHLPVEVLSVTTVGNRVRLGLAGPQPLAAEITTVSADELALRAGMRVTASWKAAATRLVAI
jgi:molybdate transport system ATP-binding protein